MITPTFRLLDARTGWDPRPGHGLDGVTVDDGVLRLAPAVPGAAGDGGCPTCWRGPASTAPGGSADDSGCAASVPATRRSVPARCGARCGPSTAGDGLVVALLDHGRRTVLVLDAATGYLLGEAHVHGAVGVGIVGGRVLRHRSPAVGSPDSTRAGWSAAARTPADRRPWHCPALLFPA